MFGRCIYPTLSLIYQTNQKKQTIMKQKQYNREAVIILVLAFLATALLQNI